MVKGVVEEIGKRGKAYNLKVEGEWYGYGFENPDKNGVEEGYTVKFDTTSREYNGKTYYNVDTKTIEVVSTEKKSTGGSTSGGGTSRDEYWANKEANDVKNIRGIRLHGSREAAISFVRLLVDTGAIKLPAKAAAKVPFVEDLVAKYTEDFYFQNLSVVQDDNYDDGLLGWTQAQLDRENSQIEDDNEEVD